MSRGRIPTLELFCFATAAILIVGWAFALIIAWDLNAQNLPRAILIIGTFVGVGLYKRSKRLASSRLGVRN